MLRFNFGENSQIQLPLGKFHLLWQGGYEDIEGGGLQKFLDTWKGGSENIRGAPKIYILQNQKKGGAPKNWTTSQGGGLLKFQASSFNIFIPSPPLSYEMNFPFW